MAKASAVISTSLGEFVNGPNLDREYGLGRGGAERGNQMKTAELERRRASRFIPQNIPHTGLTAHDRTDKVRRKAQ